MNNLKLAANLAVLAVLAVASPLRAQDDILRHGWAVSHGCPARTRSISPENITGEKGKGGMATEGTGATRADLGRVEDLASVRSCPARPSPWARSRGRRDPAHLMTPTGSGGTSSSASIGTARRPLP
jgi:hypothetical protein